MRGTEKAGPWTEPAPEEPTMLNGEAEEFWITAGEDQLSDSEWSWLKSEGSEL